MRSCKYVYATASLLGFFGSSALATTWVYDNNRFPTPDKQVTWQSAVGTPSSSGFFYNQDNPSEYIQGNGTLTDTYVFQP